MKLKVYSTSLQNQHTTMVAEHRNEQKKQWEIWILITFAKVITIVLTGYTGNTYRLLLFLVLLQLSIYTPKIIRWLFYFIFWFNETLIVERVRVKEQANKQTNNNNNQLTRIRAHRKKRRRVTTLLFLVGLVAFCVVYVCVLEEGDLLVTRHRK